MPLLSANPASFVAGIASVAIKVAWLVLVRRAKLHWLNVGPNLADALLLSSWDPHKEGRHRSDVWLNPAPALGHQAFIIDR